MVINAVPDKDEQELFLHYQPEDISNVAVPDLFFMDLSSVPQVKVRVEAVTVYYDWPELAAGIKAKQDKLKVGISMQREDKKLPILLQYSLAYGNYLNGQSAKGGASAFKLDIMSQLDDVKSNDNKTNLLIVILERIEKEVGVLYDVEFLAKIDYEFLCKVSISNIG